MKQDISEKELKESVKEDKLSIISRKLRKFHECKTLYRLLDFFDDPHIEYATPLSFSRKFSMDSDYAESLLKGLSTMGFLMRKEVMTTLGRRIHYFPAPSKKEFIIFKFKTKIIDAWKSHLLKKKYQEIAVVGVMFLAGVVGVLKSAGVVGVLKSIVGVVVL